MNINRESILHEARSWIGTSFHHQGRVKRSGANSGGCDCIGLILGVANNLGIIDEEGFRKYNAFQYGGRQKPKELQAALDNALIIKKSRRRKRLLTGDIALLNITDNLQHVGIIGRYNEGSVSYMKGGKVGDSSKGVQRSSGGGLSIIHCYIQARGVVEHNLGREWRDKITGIYEFNI